MLTLQYRAATTIPLEVDGVTPNALAGKTLAEIQSHPILHGNRDATLADFFTATGDLDDGVILIEGDCRVVKRIGVGMSSGRIIVHGSVGMHLGGEMTGGLIEVHGDAGDWLGAEMRGGRIHVKGSAGHHVGAAYRGGQVGMRGGVILIEGRVGHEAGAHMRRGLIAVGGDAGDFTGVSMIAGSIIVFGAPGKRTGAAMKRGTVLFCGPAPTLLPTFRFDCDYEPVFPALYFRQLRQWGFPFDETLTTGSWRRFSGDLTALGRGEVLHRIRP
jgi:formylmethanofuran dehydrogenase subunit C